MEINEIVLKRYKVKQEICSLKSKITNLSRVEKIMDNCIIYESLKLSDVSEAKRFKKNNLDNLKHGLFKSKINFNGKTGDLLKILKKP